MKSFAGFFLVILAFLPEAAPAETIGVRSGDHPGFTRLVIQLKGQEDWVFGRADGGFEFRPSREDITYRLNGVFDKIGRSRIEDVRDLGDGRLRLAVTCNCHGVVDELPDGQVVLDIVTGLARAPGTGADAELPPFNADPEEPAAIAELTEPVLADDPPTQPASVSNRAGLPLTFPGLGRFSPGSASPSDTVPERPAGSVDHRLATVGPALELSTDGNPAPQPANPAPSGNEDRSARIAKTESALLEQVARAAAQGLLDADMSVMEENVADTTQAPVEELPAPVIAPPVPPVTQRGHITVETSVDRAASDIAQHGDETVAGDACIDPAVFDIGAWGDEIANGTDIGAYRSSLITELDVADGAGVSALVHNYLFITFGAEAKALMRRYPDSVERPDLLFAMAEIMDDGQSTNAAEMVDQMSCDGATALWASLAQPEFRPGQAINRDAVVIAFGALPAHLRRHLGPKLAERLLASGDLETAHMIRAAIDRVSDEPTSDYGMLTAQFELEAGQVDQATAILDTVVEAGDAVLPDALLQRVETTLAAGGAVADDVVVLLDSLAFQFRGTDTERRMVDAGIRARASAADFETAFEQLDGAAAVNLFSPERSAQLRDGLYDLLTGNTADTEFLRLALPRLEEVASSSAEPRRALARRLLDLGLAGPARDALGSDDTMPDVSERHLLARAALVENRPAVAIGYLAGLADAAALALRAEALEMAQDHAGALRAYEATGDRDKMLRMAWRGGLWPEVAQLDPGSIGAVAQLMVGDRGLREDDRAVAIESVAETGAEPARMRDPMASTSDVADADFTGPTGLAAARTLIAESEAAREALAALLDEIVSPADADATRSVPGL